MYSAYDHQFMAKAIRLAKRGLYTTDPNPRVGCVIVKDNRIISSGWHQLAGQAHAEVNAINQAKVDLSGSTLYVSLEPCCHHGKTPACTDAIITAGIVHVIAASEDPNPQVAGKGIKTLNQAGVTTQCGLLSEQARKLNPGHYMRFTKRRPYVRLKSAMSLDGRTALEDGQSQWITGQDAREDVQRIRAQSSAVLSGIGTVLKDDPSLNVRIESIIAGYPGDVRQPLRVVLDSQLRIPEHARMLKLPGDILIATTIDDASVIEKKLTLLRYHKDNVEIITIPANHSGHCDLPSLMSVLAEAGINELLVECGSSLAGAFLLTGIVDEFICYIAPHILGHTAQSLFTIPGFESMDQRIEFEIEQIRQVGTDYRLIAKPKPN